MKIKIHAVGGYEEVGRNMTCLEIGDEAVILDMGLYLDPYLAIQEKTANPTTKQLMDNGAIPDDSVISHLKNKVKAIIIGHGHLDHIGGIQWLSSKYNCPIIATPYTIEIIKSMQKDNKFTLKNKLVSLNPNATYTLSEAIQIEFINVTHSILQTVMINIKTPEGSILYTSDYKFDNNPVVGKKTNKKRLRELASENVLALIIESTRANEERKTFSESVARDMLKDVLLGMENAGHGIILTTFSSHIARQKSMLEIGRELGRKVVFMGRSLHKYIDAAEKLDFVSFSKKSEILWNPKLIKKRLAEINKARDKYLLIMTGNQGEPTAMLTRVVKDELPFSILPGDFVIFSCKTIPTPIIQANRRLVEQKLHNKKARIFKEVHVSGHASREDHRDLIKMVAPEHIIPAHGDMAKLAALADLATEIGYKLGKTVHILQNGQELILK